MSNDAAQTRSRGTSVLAGYHSFEYQRHRVYSRGTGPAVLVLHEMPSMHAGVVAFADRLVDRGYTAFLPSLFGRAGEDTPRGALVPLRMLRAFGQVCVSGQFFLLRDRTSPAVEWLRALARDKHSECGGPGVGVVGMCITGGFGLAMAVEPAVLAPVLSQPSLPFAVPGRRASLGIDRDDLVKVRCRTEQDGLRILGLRFSRDRLCPPVRFDRLETELGKGFECVEIDAPDGNPHGIAARAHSVLTVDFRDEPGHPTRDALDRVLNFLDARLRPAGTRSAAPQNA